MVYTHQLQVVQTLKLQLFDIQLVFSVQQQQHALEHEPKNR